MRQAVIALALGLAVQTGGTARGQIVDFVGHWRQVSSNAGDCPRCSLVFHASGGALSVKANNGWSGDVAVDSQGRIAAATGKGAWKEGAGGSYSGLAFSVEFQLVDDRLHMQMTVPRPGGRVSRIKAVYERSPLISRLTPHGATAQPLGLAQPRSAANRRSA